MSLPRVPLDSSNERQHRTIIATTVNELVKTRPPFDRTGAERDAGVTPVDYGYAPGPTGGHILRFIPPSEHAAILAGTSTYDASDDAQRWLDSLKPGDIATIVGTVRAQGLVLKTSDVRFTGGGFLVPVNNDSTATVLTIGDDSDNTLVRRISGHIRIGDITTNYTSYTNITGLKLVRCVEFVLDLDLTACAIGLDLAPAESAVAYNVFNLGLVYNNKIGIRFNPTGTGGFANGNVFHGGRFSHGQALAGIGLVGIQFNTPGTFPPDNNVFYGPKFEHKGHSVEFNGCTSNRILDVRMEPIITSGTEGTDWESELVTFDADAARNLFHMCMNTDPFSHANRNKDHGAGTRVNDYSFTLSTDLTKWFFPGQVLRVTVSGTAFTVIVHESSFSSPNTTVRVYSPVITADPSATRTPRITKLGSLANAVRWDRHTDGTSDDISSLSERHVHHQMYRSSLYIHGLGSNHPALTLSQTTGTDKALRVLDQNDTERAYITANGDSKVRSLDINTLASITENGYAQVARFGLGLTPIATQAANADTSGATLVQLEAEVNQLKATLRAFGFIAP